MVYSNTIDENCIKNGSVLFALKSVNDAHVIQERLSKTSLLLEVVQTKRTLLELLKVQSFELIILDLELEDGDAISICQEIRQSNRWQQPAIIVLGDRPEDYVQSMVFDSGADDYILKPLKTPLVWARIKAIMSRKARSIQDRQVLKNGLIINLEEHLVYLDTKKIELPRKEFDILNLLYSNPKKIFTRLEITTFVWGNDLENKDHNIDVFVSRIRKELGREVIKTIKGVGYILAA